MSLTPFSTSEIIIGDTSNKIGISPQGDMTLSDPYVPLVRLRDLVSGNISIDPALMVFIENTDSGWTIYFDSYGQVGYYITIPHNWQLTSINDTHNILPLGIQVNVYDSANKLILVDSVVPSANEVTLYLSRKTTIKVIIKRIG
jgi:hypothetical protein